MADPQSVNPQSAKPRLILASASLRRLDLLASVGLAPDAVEPTDINEDPIPGELPGPLALRLAQEKLAACPATDGFVLAADTVVGVGRRILGKPVDAAEARRFLALMSGRNHRVHTGVAIRNPNGETASRLVETRIKFKRLSEAEIATYMASGEWQGKAGAYGIQGMAGRFVIQLTGSYTAVVGLPVYESACLLEGLGFPINSPSEEPA